MFSIIVNEVKEFLREKTNLFFFLMFPVILVFLLGNLLQSLDTSDDAIGKISIQYLINTDDMFQKAAITGFIQSVESDNITFTEVKNLEAARKLTGQDKIDAAVEFVGKPLEIHIYEGKNEIKNRTVSAIMNGFVQTDKSISTVIKTVPQAIQNLNTTQQEFIKAKDLGVNRSMLDYYAISMLAMISFMSMLLGAGAFTGERISKTINRLIIAPQNRVLMFLQKIAGMVPQVLLQIVIIMVISVLVFHAHYAADWVNNIYLFFMFFVVTICMVSIGAVIGLVIKANPTAVIMPVLWIMMFFGGTYSKEVHIKGFSDAMPIYQIQQAAFDLSVFGRHGKADMVILYCLIALAAALITGAFIFSRKVEEK